ncbi:MAG: STN domain-containing protein, partial [Chitinophagaceae bacterium]
MFKCTFLLTFILCLNASADGFSQRSIVTIDIRETNLKKALSVLAEKGDIRILYSEANLPPGKGVSLHVKDMPVLDALQLLLKNTDLKYKALEGGLVVIIAPANETVKDIVIQGTVTNSE